MGTELTTTKKLLKVGEIPEDTTEELLKLLKYVELLKAHFDLTLEVLESKSKGEIEKIKEKFSCVKKYYEKLSHKDDLTPIPAKYVVTLFHDKMIAGLSKVLKKCFTIKRDKKLCLVISEENKAKLKILVSFFTTIFSFYVCFS